MLARLPCAALCLLVLAPLTLDWAAANPGAPTAIHVTVRDADSRRPLPCRLTLLDARGALVAAEVVDDPWLATRPGVIYTGTGEARFSLPQGRYRLHVTRGMEYGLVTRDLEVGPRPVRLALSLAREVDTHGYISSDTHIHTLTHSGHGDSTIRERMATIAGEGIELAIATDHNHHTDYAPHARETHTHPHFTPVIGNEVTTPIGHFNAFPILPGSRLPNPRLADWQSLLKEIRDTPGVRVVVLNHPSDTHSGFTPTDPRRFHPASGEALDGSPWEIDGIEVVTSAALQSDFMKPYRDWFALLNRGRRIVGIGSSDSHDVDAFILGQARTYIASTATTPDQIDVQEACDSLLAGRALVSMGLLVEAWVDDRGVGEFVTGGGPEMRLRLRIQGPRWTTCDRIDLYANGQKVWTGPVAHADRAVVKFDRTLSLPRPAHDVWVVAIASGPGVRAPYWPTPRPYQPLRPDWDPYVLASTSPIRIDGDGDGIYSSPRDYARRALQAAGDSPERLMEALATYDEATAVQAAALCRERSVDLTTPAFRRAVDGAAPSVRHGFVAYRRLLVE
jgi:hypothetical protein